MRRSRPSRSITAVNNLRELEYRISYDRVSDIRAEEWYRSGKGDPAHDGDCLRYPNKHPDLLTYRESDEGEAEVEEVRGKQGSWRSQETVLKETERFIKYFINADLLLSNSDEAWREPLVVTARNYLQRNSRTRSKTGTQQRAGQVSNRYLKRPTYTGQASAQERSRSERGRSHPAGSQWTRKDDPRDAQ